MQTRDCSERRTGRVEQIDGGRFEITTPVWRNGRKVYSLRLRYGARRSPVSLEEGKRDGLTRSRSFGPRGLLASPRLLSPPPRRLKSQDLQRDIFRDRVGCTKTNITFENGRMQNSDGSGSSPGKSNRVQPVRPSQSSATRKKCQGNFQTAGAFRARPTASRRYSRLPACATNEMRRVQSSPGKSNQVQPRQSEPDWNPT